MGFVPVVTRNGVEAVPETLAWVCQQDTVEDVVLKVSFTEATVVTKEKPQVVVKVAEAVQAEAFPVLHSDLTQK